LQATRTIPIVFATVSDPVGDRIVESVARPGGNGIGFTNIEASMGGKWVEILKEWRAGRQCRHLRNPQSCGHHCSGSASSRSRLANMSIAGSNRVLSFVSSRRFHCIT
jgi:hypothetical protein